MWAILIALCGVGWALFALAGWLSYCAYIDMTEAQTNWIDEERTSRHLSARLQQLQDEIDSRHAVFGQSQQWRQEEVSQLRLDLAREGWHSDDKLSDQGWSTDHQVGYSIWIYRWNWHGVRLGTRVSFHFGLSPERVDAAAMAAIWIRAAEQVRKAWQDFPDCLPSQGRDGQIRRDDHATRIIERAHEGNPWTTRGRQSDE